ncbi:hypothetical protein AAW50_00615 [Mycoplasmopsis canis]|uniref:restriction endonuclease subunit S n=1 Tax=Mycoplasmopsis canis TaxID=29555 RepID=UPI000624B7B1|nr:restriction endonuclease subunit S [Mycoplasmopsis canis]AKF40951.1 hypothetical protein AAW50_00615 [Mycoplasmopsis canis]
MKYKVRDLLQIKNGKDYKKIKNGNYPVFGSGGVITYIEEFLYNHESILLPRKGSLNNIMYVNEPFWTVDTMYWTKINNNIVLPKYLYFYLKLMDISTRSSGTTLPSMTFDAYYNINVHIPNIKVQKNVLNLLNMIDDKIEINNKINDNLAVNHLFQLVRS